MEGARVRNPAGRAAGAAARRGAAPKRPAQTTAFWMNERRVAFMAGDREGLPSGRELQAASIAEMRPATSTRRQRGAQGCQENLRREFCFREDMTGAVGGSVVDEAGD